MGGQRDFQLLILVNKVSLLFALLERKFCLNLLTGFTKQI